MKRHCWSMIGPLASTLVGLLLAVVPAHATVISYTLTDEFSGGATPSSTLTATFDDTACGTDCVRLTMSVTGTSTTEFVDLWDFNFNPDSSVGSLTFTFVSGQNTSPVDTVGQSADAFKPDGDGLFDIEFQFSNANNDTNRFTPGETSVWDITGITGLTASMFDVLSTCEKGCGTDTGFHTAAHVGGITGQTADSGWVGDTGGGGGFEEVPEPATLLLLGSALLGSSAAGTLRSLRRRKK